MPEYLAPGVYMEETSFRSKSIEGVSTSTAGFVGPTRFGPISGHPELLTSLTDFERIYGGIEDITFSDASGPHVNYLAHGVRAFFEEGGKRLYVVRVFGIGEDELADFLASKEVPPPGNGAAKFKLVARFPGQAGNVRVTFRLRVGENVLKYVKVKVNGEEKTVPTLTRVQPGDLVHVSKDGGVANTTTGLSTVLWDAENKKWQLAMGGDDPVDLPAENDEREIRPLSVLVEVERPIGDGRFSALEGLGEFSFNTKSDNALLQTFVDKPSIRYAELTIPFAIKKKGNNDALEDVSEDDTVDLVQHLLSTVEFKDSVYPGKEEGKTKPNPTPNTIILADGADGILPQSGEYEGHEKDDTGDATGLNAFEAVLDISIIAAPGYTAGRTEEAAFAIQGAVINHCEYMRYRIAVLEAPKSYLPTQALNFRNLRSSKYAAIYYPWIFVADPRPGQGGKRLLLPPSGFVSGIYARNDITRAVYKAPANEVVRLAIDFELRVNKAQQELLNPEGVNCFRFFEGRGFLLWGARTISDDPEWKYVNLRRYFAYLERSIERGTQWAVFEPNNEPLWANIRRTIEDFLLNEWKMGALMGSKPEQAYFVKCDRSTMTQNDIDNGRLICLIGVSPVRPAEFVIFRIGQWTADAK